MKRIAFLLFVIFSVCFTLPAQQNSFVMEGTVFDETNEPLPGATVYIRDKVGIGTSTNIDGKFTIRASRGDMLLLVTIKLNTWSPKKKKICK